MAIKRNPQQFEQRYKFSTTKAIQKFWASVLIHIKFGKPQKRNENETDNKSVSSLKTTDDFHPKLKKRRKIILHDFWAPSCNDMIISLNSWIFVLIHCVHMGLRLCVCVYMWMFVCLFFWFGFWLRLSIYNKKKSF